VNRDGASLLASCPASSLNQISARTGIPTIQLNADML
jgi:hypothetical protein